MKRPSFRLRIALLSAALAGSALLGFGAVSWFGIYNAQISHLDAELVNQLMRVNRSPEPEQWQFYRDSLPYALRIDTKIPIALLVQDSNGNTLYQSNSVPADLDVNRLLAQSLRLTPPAPPPPPRFHPLPSRLERSLPNRSRPIRPPLPRFTTEQTATGAWRIGAANFPNVRFAIAVSLQAINQEMATIGNIFLVSIGGSLLLVASGAWLVSGSALRPIRQLTGIIQQVTVKGLDRRIGIGTTDVEFAFTDSSV